MQKQEVQQHPRAFSSDDLHMLTAVGGNGSCNNDAVSILQTLFFDESSRNNQNLVDLQYNESFVFGSNDDQQNTSVLLQSTGLGGGSPFINNIGMQNNNIKSCFIVSPQKHQTILDQIEKEELDKKVLHNLKNGEPFKFYKQHYIPLDNPCLLPLDYDQKTMEIIQFHYLAGLNNPLFQSLLMGKPRCLCASTSLIAAAGTQGNILVLERSSNPDNPADELRSDKFYGSVTTIDIVEPQQDLLVAGYEQGQLGFFDLTKNAMVKTHQEAHKNRVVQVKILRQSKTATSGTSRALMISSDIAGVTVMTKFKKTLMFYQAESTLLLGQQEFPVMQIQVLEDDNQIKFFTRNYNMPSYEQDRFVALISPVKLWIIKISIEEEVVEYLKIIINEKFENPRDILQSQGPFSVNVELYSSICWGQGLIPSLSMNASVDFNVNTSNNYSVIAKDACSGENKDYSDNQLLLFCSWNNFLQFCYLKKNVQQKQRGKDSYYSNGSAASGQQSASSMQKSQNYPTTSNFAAQSTSAASGRVQDWSQGFTPQQSPDISGKRYQQDEFSNEENNEMDQMTGGTNEDKYGEMTFDQLYQFEISPVMKHDQLIIYMAFISDSLLMIVDKLLNVIVTHTSDFAFPANLPNVVGNTNNMQVPPSYELTLLGFKHISYRIDLQNSLLHIENLVTFNSQQQHQQQNQQSMSVRKSSSSQAQDNNKKQNNTVSIKSVNNSFVCFPSERIVYFLCPDKIGIAALSSWESILTHLIGNKKWLLAMHFLIQVVEGKFKFLGFNFQSQYIINNQQQTQNPVSPFYTPDKTATNFNSNSGYRSSGAGGETSTLNQQLEENRIMKEIIEENSKIIATKYIHEAMKQLLLQEQIKPNNSCIASIKDSEKQQNQLQYSLSPTLSPSPSQSVAKTMRQNQEKREIITRVMDFLVKMKQNEILFQDVRKLLCAYLQEQSEMFYECLEPFVLNGRLASSPVPDKAFFEMIQHFKEKKNFSMVEALVTTLPLDSYDTTMLMTQCMDQGLIKALIHICTKGREEVFIAPLSKLWGHYVFHKDKGREEALYFGLRALWYVRLSLRKQMVNGGTLSDEKFTALVKQFGEFFFYEQNLKEMLLMSPQACFEVLSQFLEGDTALILNQTNDLKIKLPPQTTLDLNWIEKDRRKMDEALIMVLNCYEDTLQLLLQKEQQQLMLKEQQQQQFQQQQQLQNDVWMGLQGLLTTPRKEKKPRPKLLSEEVTADQLRGEYYIFLAKLIQMGNFKINKIKIVETAFYLIENPEALDSLRIDEEMKRFREWPNKEEVQEVLKGEFIYKLLILIEKELIAEEMYNLQKKADDSTFTEISRIFAHKKKDYGKCLDLYLKTSNKLVKDRMFGWLWDTLAQLEIQNQTDEMEKVTSCVVQRLTEILKINSEKSREMISRFLKRSEKDIVVAKLGVNKDLQLEYIQHMLVDREDGKKIDNEILTKFIELLCEKYPERVLPELIQWDYPLDQSLLICKKFKIMDATAFLLERTGATDEALQMYVQILNSSFDQYLDILQKQKDWLKSNDKNKANQGEMKLSQSQDGADSGLGDSQEMFDQKGNRSGVENDNDNLQISQEFTFQSGEAELVKLSNTIIKHAEASIEVCQKSNKFENMVEIWFKLLDDVLDICHKKANREDPMHRPMLNLFAQIIGRMIEELSKNIEINILIQRINEKYTNLYLGELKQTFIRMIANYQHIENILENASELIKQSLMDFAMQQDRSMKKGTFARPVCDNCDQLINQCDQKQIIIFSCGHLFHLFCASYNMQKNENMCPACMRNEINAYFHIMLRSKNKAQQLFNQGVPQLKIQQQQQQQITVNQGKDDTYSSGKIQSNNIMNSDGQKVIIVNLEKGENEEQIKMAEMRKIRMKLFDEQKRRLQSLQAAQLNAYNYNKF